MSKSSIPDPEINKASERGRMQAKLAESLMDLGDALHKMGMTLGFEGTIHADSLLSYNTYLGILGLAAKELQ